MKFSSLKLGLVFSFLFVLGFAVSRADDFQWNQQQGPPQQLTGFACTQSAACASTTCQAVNPPVSVIPDGGMNYVVVQSYFAMQNFTYGTCQGTSPPDFCNQYPNVRCARLQIFGMPNCNIGDLWGTKLVYSGNCTP
jgi:hypothetical protein